MRKGFSILFLFSLISSICGLSISTNGQSSFQGEPYIIHLKSGSFTPEENFETSFQKEVNDKDRFFVVQFSSIPSSQERKQMEAVGIVFEDYLPNNAYLVFAPRGLNFSKLNNFGVRAIFPYESSFKVNSEFNDEIPSHARRGGDMLGLSILTHSGVSSQEFIQAIMQLEGQIVRTPESGNLYFIDIPKSKIKDLLNLNSVKWVEYIEPDPIPDDFKGRSLHRANAIDRPSANGYHYDGTGVSVALADDGAVGPHIDLEGRVVLVGNMGSNGTHGDMTVGILMGAGNLIPEYAGMATGVSMRYYRIDGYPHVNSAVSNYNTFGTVITSTSYSEVSGGIYTSTAQFVDQQIHQNPSIIHVFSAGNAGSGFSTITGGRKAAKNTIATANLEYQDVLTPSSSRGPAADGRLKPDISANGTNQMSLDANNGYSPGGGTSAACPGIAGILAQLYQAHRDLNGGADPKSSLMKAILLNSAEDLGNPGPDYSFGWGRVNALRALKTMEENRIMEDSLSQGDSVIHTITVPAGVGELKVMVYWLDKEGSPAASQALVNNLDMTLTDPSNNTWQPWVLNPSSPSANAIRGVDNLNNVEQVTLSTPAAGSYSLKVKGTSVPFGPQNYHVVYQFRMEELKMTYPLGGESFVPGHEETIRWDAYGNTLPFNLDYSLDSGQNWINIASNVSPLQRYYDWTLPNGVSTGNALVRVSRGFQIGVSEATFNIIGVPDNFELRWVCNDSLQLRWDSVENADSYEVSQLGSMYMDSIGITTNTYFTVNNVSSSNEYWFSVKALNQNGGFVGRRAYALRKTPGVLDCPIANDIALYRLIEPQLDQISSCQSIDSSEVIFEIENIGTTMEENFPIRIKTNSGTVINYQFTDTLYAYETRRIRLPNRVNIPDPQNFKIWTDLSNDSKRQNDSSISNVFITQMASIPYSESINQFSNCATTSNCEATICNLLNGWVNVDNGNGDEIDWRTNSGGTPSSGTGPTSGFGGSGKYLYLEASGAPECVNKEALLISPCFDLNTAVQPELSFRYHMFGTSIGELHVDILSNGVWYEDFTPPLVGNQGNSWQQRIVDLSVFNGSIVNIRFRGITGPSWSSDISIDEINVTDNFAPPVAAFTFSQPNCAGQTITFTDNSSGTAINHNWDFGQNASPATASGVGPHNVTFTNTGLKTVQLIVNNVSGSDTNSQNLLLDTLPEGNFIWSTNLDTVSFINQSSNASSYSWDFGDGNTDNSFQPTHVYASPGTYTVTLTVNNGCGPNTISKDVTVGTVGILDEGSLNFNIYPNPTNGLFTIKATNLTGDKFDISIIDSKGKEVIKKSTNSLNSSFNVNFDLSKLSSGLYTIKIIGENSISIRKVSYVKN